MDETTGAYTHSPLADSLGWQQGLLRGLLRWLVVVGGLAVVIGSYNAYTFGNLWVIPFYLATYAALLLITFVPNVSYPLQAGSVVGLLYGLGVLDLLESGRAGDGRLFLLACPFAAALFFRRRAGLAALALSAVTLLAFGLAFSTGRLVLPPSRQAASAELVSWVSNTAVLLLMGALLVIPQDYVVARLTQALAQSRALIHQLEANQASLGQRAHDLQERETELARRTLQMQTLLDIGRVASSTLHPDELLQQTVDLICERFGHYFAGVFLVDAEGQHAGLRAARGEPGRQLLSAGLKLAVGGRSLVGWAAAHRQPRVAQDARADPLHLDHPLLADTRSEAAVPLMTAERLLGVLDVHSLQPNAFGDQDVAALQGLAGQVAVGLEGAMLFQQTQTTLGRAEVLYEASRRLTTATMPAEVAEAIIASVAESGADGCVVVRFDFTPDGAPEALVYLGSWRRDRAPLFQPGLRLPIAKSPFPFKMISTLWAVADVEREGDLPDSAREVFRATEARAVANIPLRSKGQVIGQVVVVRNTPGPFTDTAMRLYEMLSDQAAVALERADLLVSSRRQVEEEAALRTVGDRLSRAMDTPTVLQSAAQELSRLLRAAGVYVELGPAADAPQPEHTFSSPPAARAGADGVKYEPN